ncbi:hypothetical protein K0M31_017159 [Melipona bicolor]|uniref:Uncharacterized protein n=1 Tax=Melipona bicolor TaxID=60889 RepID=A0AA40G4D1_9HYME|nr:hypothetical protein K0M31_017159 [Melipona bicolor]
MDGNIDANRLRAEHDRPDQDSERSNVLAPTLGKAEKKKVEFTTCRNCTLFIFDERFTTRVRGGAASLVLARGQQRLTAYYRAQPIYRAPVSDRDLFEGCRFFSARWKPPSSRDPLQRATFGRGAATPAIVPPKKRVRPLLKDRFRPRGRSFETAPMS